LCNSVKGESRLRVGKERVAKHPRCRAPAPDAEPTSGHTPPPPVGAESPKMPGEEGR
jgi:hypothetical protein